MIQKQVFSHNQLATIVTLVQELWTELLKLWKLTLFKIGDNSVSFQSIIVFILSVILVIFLSNTLSNFLKNRLLIRVEMDEGNREAIAVIVRYLLVGLGIIIVLQSIGFNLGSLVVLAGGLGVGIGFGIQDLTTNFVSGLTLLLDRPVKVGDYVELDGLSGTVKAISIRSTIIKTLDNSSVIVPNSNMIDNKVVNWSYESSSCCLRIPVRVPDDSDPLAVTEALLNAAYMESAALNNPNPKVLFVEFGDNCFKFELLVWIDRPNEREFIKSSLNFEIEYSLRQQGISLSIIDTYLLLKNTENNLDKNNQESSHVTLPTQQRFSLSNLLRQIKYFGNFSDPELRQLIENGYRQRLQRSEVLFRENDPGDAFYIILSGAVEVYVEKINKHLTNLQAGNFFGEISLMLGIPRTASIKAIEETVLFAINQNGFQKLLRDNPELYEQIVEELAKNQEELAQRQQQLRDMGLVDTTEDDQNPLDWVRKRLKNLFKV
ncbi:mechanosensitive ion channel domain-containing protein [Nostoc favosum]|uniref:Mechanosensitive ion channel n=1 Tax=Nostoc favosum CHAB5714 TaxID=2780399 RepID=A0ABS8IDF1_9NOSO|nr:mechanosensitive ion channel domain-containing protein [Nostoc favosum]MCC5602207.1 mechanosensitive ion channel [Nostoc favosum CHAB5714]